MDEGIIFNLRGSRSKNNVKCRHCRGNHWTSNCPCVALCGGKIPDSDKNTEATPSALVDAGNPAGTKYLPTTTKADVDWRRGLAPFGGETPDSDKKTEVTTSALADAGNPAGTKYLPTTTKGDVDWRGGPAPFGGETPYSDKKTEVTTDADNPADTKYLPTTMKDDNTSTIHFTNLRECFTESDLEDLVKPFGPIKKLDVFKDEQTAECNGAAYVHFKFRRDAANAIAVLNGYGYDNRILSVDWLKPPVRLNP